MLGTVPLCREGDRLHEAVSEMYPDPDLSCDPSVVNGIVQPSSVVMGYVYRPYTANAFNFGVRYLW